MPERLLDPVMGWLEYDASLDGWTGQVEIGGEDVGLLLWSQDEQMRLDAETLAMLRRFYQQVNLHLPALRKSAAQEVLERLPNWTSPLHPPELGTLVRQMTLDRLELSIEGQAALFFWVGDLLPRPLVAALVNPAGDLLAVDLKG